MEKFSPNDCFAIFQIISVSTGKDLSRGEEGEVCVRGPQVMKGYLDNEEATRKTMRDGWLFTGGRERFPCLRPFTHSPNLRSFLRFHMFIGFHIVDVAILASLMFPPPFELFSVWFSVWSHVLLSFWCVNVGETGGGGGGGGGGATRGISVGAGNPN